MTIKDIVNEFNTTPFLFVGSGVSRRYLNLPDWRGLLEHFAKEINDDEFIFNSYESKARNMECEYGILPKIAELIQKDYDEKWFSDSSIRRANSHEIQKVKEGVSPFKVEIAAYLKSIAQEQEAYADEIKILHDVSERGIAGVITTNYDSFLEDHLSEFTKYVGQSQLIFAPIQGIAEIYKIHGSLERPESLVITEQDYREFDQKSAYLIAKLMTLFMEYPIIFLGYSISDRNVQSIIKGIVDCLDDDQLNILQNRFVFVEYKKGHVGAEITQYTIMVNDRPLNMRGIVLEDFQLLYRELANKKSKLPVRLLRRFRQELYDFTLTNETTANLRVAALEDERVADDELVLAIGKAKDLGLKGLSGISGNEWYRNVVLNDLEFSNDELLEYAFPAVVKHFNKKIPIHRYLSGVKNEHLEAMRIAKDMNFDNIISKTYQKNRKYLGEYKTVRQIWQNENKDKKKAYRLIAYLTEDQISLDELEEVLMAVFNDDVDVLEHAETAEKSGLRLLIRIYDYLKWGKTKEPST
ncbi:MAG: SIR2 family protein [Lachnospiraceae bacterium]|nr:SIR2 family protein [Lachnospiraceae bacterium]